MWSKKNSRNNFLVFFLCFYHLHIFRRPPFAICIYHEMLIFFNGSICIICSLDFVIFPPKMFFKSCKIIQRRWLSNRFCCCWNGKWCKLMHKFCSNFLSLTSVQDQFTKWNYTSETHNCYHFVVCIQLIWIHVYVHKHTHTHIDRVTRNRYAIWWAAKIAFYPPKMLNSLDHLQYWFPILYIYVLFLFCAAIAHSFWTFPLFAMK